MQKLQGQLDNSIEIVTPENIAFQYRVAGPFRRLPAYVLDIAIRLVLLGVLIGVVALSGLSGLGVAIGLICWFVISWFYGGLFETYWNGQTPGKRLMRIRVLSNDGQPINGLQGILRNVLRAADSMPVVPLPIDGMPVPVPLFQVGLIVPMFNRRFQRLGDLACGTMIVVEDRPHRIGMIEMNEPAAIQLASQLPINLRIDRSLSRALSAYVERRVAFSRERRHEIVRRLGATLCQHYRLDPNLNYDTLLCALYYRAFVSNLEDPENGSTNGATRGTAARPGTVSPLALSG